MPTNTQTQPQSKWNFIKGAVWIAAGGFIAKLIGAIYRIPLTNLIGGYGLGLYQMVYPTYCLLLTLSATGIPSSIAKLTAERISRGESTQSVFKTSMTLFLLIGGVGTLLMAVLAPLLSAAQNVKQIVGGYYALAPSVFLVSAISVFRGWFQGKNQMFPTAISEIIEQAVKVAFGLLFAYMYRGNVERAVVFLLLSVSISEVVACAVLFFIFQRVHAPHQSEKEGGRCAMKTVLKLSIPVTFSSILLPISGLVDSVLVPRLLGQYASNALALYGLFAGGAVTMINLPVSICYGVAAATIPSVASASAKVALHEEQEGQPTQSIRKRIFFSLAITFLLGGLGALGLFWFAKPITKLVFRSLQGEELQTLISLIRALSVSALTLSCVQTLSACLTAQGKPQYAALSMLIAIILKTIAYVFWLQNAQTSVFGLAYATNLCYLVAFLLDLLYNLKVSKKQISPKGRKSEEMA